MVAQESIANKMSPSNLACVFAINLIRPSHGSVSLAPSRLSTSSRKSSSSTMLPSLGPAIFPGKSCPEARLPKQWDLIPSDQMLQAILIWSQNGRLATFHCRQ
ncbi:hypothetical protein GJAV_G00272250 [Gymnothorax javanicus]|nr:hypothetical protein GJAV_G00272250 [Gymnothorax javanicus]